MNRKLHIFSWFLLFTVGFYLFGIQSLRLQASQMEQVHAHLASYAEKQAHDDHDHDHEEAHEHHHQHRHSPDGPVHEHSHTHVPALEVVQAHLALPAQQTFSVLPEDTLLIPLPLQLLHPAATLDSIFRPPISHV